MFPGLGRFNEFICPSQQESSCLRSFCHFRHSKEINKKIDEGELLGGVKIKKERIEENEIYNHDKKLCKKEEVNDEEKSEKSITKVESTEQKCTTKEHKRKEKETRSKQDDKSHKRDKGHKSRSKSKSKKSSSVSDESRHKTKESRHKSHKSRNTTCNQRVDSIHRDTSIRDISFLTAKAIANIRDAIKSSQDLLNLFEEMDEMSKEPQLSLIKQYFLSTSDTFKKFSDDVSTKNSIDTTALFEERIPEVPRKTKSTEISKKLRETQEIKRKSPCLDPVIEPKRLKSSHEEMNNGIKSNKTLKIKPWTAPSNYTATIATTDAVPNELPQVSIAEDVVKEDEMEDKCDDNWFENEDKDENKEIEEPVYKPKKRISHAGSVNNVVVEEIDGVPQVDSYKDTYNISREIRQLCLENLYRLLISKLPKNVASKAALEEEIVVHEKAISERTYRQRYRFAVTKICKNNYVPPNLEQTKLRLQYPKEISGVLTYTLLEQHVMTRNELEANGYPFMMSNGFARISKDAPYYKHITKKIQEDEYNCMRCHKWFKIDEETGFSLPSEECTFHTGRVIMWTGGLTKERRFVCCKGTPDKKGCITWEHHVPDMTNDDRLEGYVQTEEASRDTNEKQFYALDCEMVYTTHGIELARVTVVSDTCEEVYNELVLPPHPVIDYNTRFSGITEETLRNVHKRLVDVQKDLLRMFNKNTILIGHSLESDLKALKIVHYNVVDTSVVFKHRDYPAAKFSLKLLALQNEMRIQESEDGHDSLEDAVACMKIMWRRIKQDATGYKRRLAAKGLC